MINISDAQNSMEVMKREELLRKHPYKIWHGKDDKWYTYLPDKDKGRILKKRTTKKSIEDEVIGFLKSELENPTVKDVFAEWMRYRIDFERFFSDFGERKVKSVTEEEIEDFLTNCIVRFHLTSKSFYNLKIIVRGIFKRARKKNYVQFGITELISNMEISRKIFKNVQKSDTMEVFDEEEFEKVEQYLVQNLDLVSLGLLLAFLTGIREVIIPPKCTWIMQKIRMKNPFGEYMFEKEEIRIKTYSFRKRLYGICDKIGIERKSPHKIMKTYEKKAEVLNNIPEFQLSNG